MSWQNVNLYLPEFRKRKDWLNAPMMLALTGAVLVVLALTSAFEQWRLARLGGELAGKEQERLQVVAATNALLERFGVQTEDPGLQQDIRELEADLQGKQALLEFLGGSNFGNTGGFSEHLADLSRFHVQGLRLTNVQLAGGGNSITLSGQVLRAELVPLFLQNLSRGNTYAGKNFETLQIRDSAVVDDNGVPVWEFQVRSLGR